MRDRPDDHTHRRNAEATLGRKLRPGEVVDHIDEDKTNNNPANLRAVERSEHSRQHAKNRGLSALRRALRRVSGKDKTKVY